MDEFNDNTRYDDDAYAQDTDTQLADATDSYVGTPDDGLRTSGLDDPLPTDDDWMSSLPDFDTPEGQYAPFGGTGDAETSYEDEAYGFEEELDDGQAELAPKPSDALAQAAGTAGSVVSAAGKHLADGFTAVRDVRKMAKRHASAKAQMRALKAEIEADLEVLDHRTQIERDYTSIVTEQNAELASARAERDDASARITQLSADRDELDARLEALKADNEERISPYRSLMETTKGRADDAQVALSEAKRALKAAENQQSSATRRRDQRISSANRAVDNASERLRRNQASFDQQSQDPEKRDGLDKLRNQIVSDQAHLDSAREEVERATLESKREVENAQALVWDQQQRFNAATSAAESAKQEASHARAEYDAIYKECKAAEDGLSAQISELLNLIDATEQERSTADERIDAANTILAEAQDIHDTPEVTRELARKVEQEQAELARQHDEVRDIAQSEKHLRKTTRAKRITFFAVIAAVIAVILLIVWLVFLKPPQTSANPTPKPTSTQTQTTDGKTDGKADGKTDATSGNATTTTTSTTEDDDQGAADATTSTTGNGTSSISTTGTTTTDDTSTTGTTGSSGRSTTDESTSTDAESEETETTKTGTVAG